MSDKKKQEFLKAAEVEAETSISVGKPKLEESSEPKLDEPKKIFTDDDLFKHVTSVLSKHLSESRANSFSDVTISFIELEMVYRLLLTGLDRTNKLNRFINHHATKDKGILSEVEQIAQSQAELKIRLEKIKTLILPPKE